MERCQRLRHACPGCARLPRHHRGRLVSSGQPHQGVPACQSTGTTRASRRPLSRRPPEVLTTKQPRPPTLRRVQRHAANERHPGTCRRRRQRRPPVPMTRRRRRHRSRTPIRWVEVYFGTEYGWLAFDPTPSRFAGNSASVSSGDDDDHQRTHRTQPSSGQAGCRWPAPDARAHRDPRRLRRRVLMAMACGPTGSRSSPGLVVKTVRRAPCVLQITPPGARAARELWLVDLGVPTDPAATPAERVENTRRTLGIDTAGLRLGERRTVQRHASPRAGRNAGVSCARMRPRQARARLGAALLAGCSSHADGHRDADGGDHRRAIIPAAVSVASGALRPRTALGRSGRWP